MSTSKQQKAALNKWADILEAVPDEQFNMRTFRSICHTKACVCGWGTAVPFIAKNGWVLSKTKGGIYKPTSLDWIGNVELHASTVFSKVSESDFYELFFKLNQTKKQACKKLREFASRY